MPGTALPRSRRRNLRKYLLLLSIVMTLLFNEPELENRFQEWRDPQLRIERLQERSAAELRRYYQGEGSWLRCCRLLHRLDRLERLQQDR